MNQDLRPLDTAARQTTARELIAVVFRRRWVILGLFVVTTATVLGIAFSTPVTYTSVGKVQISRGERPSALQPYRQMTAWEEELATEVQVVRSVPVSQRAQKILDERAAAGAPKITLAPGNVDAKVEGKSTVLTIDYVDDRPDVAQQVCDAVITAYVDHRLQHDMSYPRAFFEGELRHAADALDQLEARRRGFSESRGIADLPQQRNAAINFLSTIRSQRSEVRADLAEAQGTLDQMVALQSDPSLDVPIVGQDFENLLIELKVKILNQETKLAQLRERYREDSAEIARAESTLESLRALLRREVESRIKVAHSRVKILESRLAPIDAEVARIESELQLMPDKETTLRALDFDIATARTRYEELSDKNNAARINERTTSSTRVDVLLPAGPAVASNPRDYGRLILAPAFSLIVGLGLAFFIDGLDSRIRNPREAESVLQLPVLASLTERRRAR